MALWLKRGTTNSARKRAAAKGQALWSGSGESMLASLGVSSVPLFSVPSQFLVSGGSAGGAAVRCGGWLCVAPGLREPEVSQ